MESDRSDIKPIVGRVEGFPPLEPYTHPPAPYPCLPSGKLRPVEATQVGGDHYAKHKIQVWHIVDEYELNFYEGNAIKYILRRKSNRKEDLEKAIHYLQKCIERLA